MSISSVAISCIAAPRSSMQPVLTPSPKVLSAARVCNQKCCSIQRDQGLKQLVLVLSGTVAQTCVQFPRDTRPISLLNRKHSVVLAQVHLDGTSHFQIELIVSFESMSPVRVVLGTQIKSPGIVTGKRARLADRKSSEGGTCDMDGFFSSQLVDHVIHMPLILPRCRWIHALIHVAGIVEHIFHLPRLQSIDGVVLAGTGRVCQIMTSSHERACIDAAPANFTLFAVPAYAQPVWTTAPMLDDTRAAPASSVDAETSHTAQVAAPAHAAMRTTVSQSPCVRTTPSRQDSNAAMACTSAATATTRTNTYNVSAATAIAAAASTAVMPDLVKEAIISVCAVSSPATRVLSASASSSPTWSASAPRTGVNHSEDKTHHLPSVRSGHHHTSRHSAESEQEDLSAHACDHVTHSAAATANKTECRNDVPAAYTQPEATRSPRVSSLREHHMGAAVVDVTAAMDRVRAVLRGCAVSAPASGHVGVPCAQNVPPSSATMQVMHAKRATPLHACSTLVPSHNNNNNNNSNGNSSNRNSFTSAALTALAAAAAAPSNSHAAGEKEDRSNTRAASYDTSTADSGQALTSALMYRTGGPTTYLRLVSESGSRTSMTAARSVLQATSLTHTPARARMRQNACSSNTDKSSSNANAPGRTMTSAHGNTNMAGTSSGGCATTAATATTASTSITTATVPSSPKLNLSLQHPYSCPRGGHTQSVTDSSNSNNNNNNSNNHTTGGTTTMSNVRQTRANAREECDESAVSEWVCASAGAPSAGEENNNNSRRSSECCSSIHNDDTITTSTTTTTITTNNNNNNHHPSNSESHSRPSAGFRDTQHRSLSLSSDDKHSAATFPFCSSEPAVEAIEQRTAAANQPRRISTHMGTSSPKSLSMAGQRLLGAATEQMRRLKQEKEKRAARLKAVAAAAAACRRRQHRQQQQQQQQHVGNTLASMNAESVSKSSWRSPRVGNNPLDSGARTTEAKRALQQSRRRARRRLRLLRNNDRLQSELRASQAAACLSASDVPLAELMSFSTNEDDFFVSAGGGEDDDDAAECGGAGERQASSHKDSAAPALICVEPRCGYGFGYMGVLREDGSYVVDSDADMQLKGALTLQLSDEDGQPPAE